MSRRTSLLRRPALLAVLAILATIVLANGFYLMGLRGNDPLMYHSGLSSPTPGMTGATWGGGRYPQTWMYTIDANDGWTVQALGRAAAHDLVHGRLPMWNLYEGLGQPLAGEMQSSALFVPFVLLQLLPNGPFAFHLALELCAGLGTLLLLRSIRLGWLAATFGACLFAVNGTFSLMTNAPFNPIAFLPWGLWGVELLVRDTREQNGRRRGVWVVAGALAFMLFAGFPETAYLQGLFMGVWALARMPELPGATRGFLLRLAGAAVVGVVMAGPIVLAFVHFLTFAHVGYHSGGSSGWHYPVQSLAGLFDPYLLGGLGAKPIGNDHAGYVTTGVALLAPFALRHRRARALKAVLTAAAILLVANMFGWAPANWLLNLIPGVRNLLLYKYGYVLVTFSLIVLAAMAVDELPERRASRRGLALTAGVAAAVLAGAVVAASRNGFLVHPTWTSVVVILTAATVVAVLLSVAAGSEPTPRGGRARGLLAFVVLTEAVVTFMMPQASASPRTPIDLAPVEYLRAHLGTGRFYTLGPIQPNYGSYFGLAQLNVNDLPIAQQDTRYILQQLKPGPGSAGARGTERAFLGSQLTPLNFSEPVQRELFHAYTNKQPAYRAAGVTHLVTAPSVVTPAQGRHAGLRRVFSSQRADIWFDAGAEPYYAMSRGTCDVTRQSYADADLACGQTATVTRRQLFTPGWTARVDGRPASVARSADGWFQDVVVPPGHHHITYSYAPPMFPLTVAASVLMVILASADLLRERRRVERRRLDLARS